MKFSLFDVAASDFLNLIFAYFPLILAYYLSYEVIINISANVSLIVLFFITPFILITMLLATIFLIRIMLPKLREGVFPVGFNRNYVAWILHLSLGRSLKMSGLLTLINSFNFLKVLFFKSLGMKISFRFISSLYLQIVDYSLIEIGEGTILTDEVQLSAHTMIKNKLWLKKIKIGKNVYVGTKTFIGLGTMIEDNCMIGPHNKTFNDKIEKGTNIAPFAWEKGKPKEERA
jgi:hypothetical protein